MTSNTKSEIENDFLEEKKKYVELSDFDSHFFDDIENRSKILSCIQCGTCSASCESGRWTALKTRMIIRKVILGDLSVLEDPDIWLCTTCYNCYERCPRNLKPTEVIIELRNYASKLGNIHPVHRKVVDFLKATGHAVPINDETIQKRKELGIDEIPPTLYKFKDEENSDLTKYAKELFNLVPPKEKKDAGMNKNKVIDKEKKA
ncbi:CoB--CoM heterodisulfide reductase subunit C [Promethearchaeum syntrophicum]|uniref:CoB--CoM heterodisulfide reductase subunit C n=1 Tax=Promethearchaeum syntrophicum TaxID=2594042 RepID=A0A5B9D990_9ARCH|nr:CoB--CoM heterodisulfide reductase subunit C [Candidatus Prometheoarchaeum syntrophicum]QEE15320.1 CoB--CoM heterodisulfide reductase iron-sulfur subunit C [Candidatus Prometheoarchaeum syntrophicum]